MSKKGIIITIICTVIAICISFACVLYRYDDNRSDLTDKSVTIYFVRHAKTDANTKGILAGRDTEAYLTDEGINMAQECGNLLRDITFDKVYVSELSRTKETAEIILSANLHIRPDITVTPYLDDISWGDLEGLTPNEAIKLYPDFNEDNALGKVDDYNFVSPYNATSKYNIVQDYNKAITMIIDSLSDGENALVVGHSSFVWFLHSHFPDMVSEYDNLPNASVTILQLDKSKLILKK